MSLLNKGFILTIIKSAHIMGEFVVRILGGVCCSILSPSVGVFRSAQPDLNYKLFKRSHFTVSLYVEGQKI